MRRLLGAPALVLMLLLGCSTASEATEKRVLPMERVELADEPAERSRGLMERRELCLQCGMLFVWPEEEGRSFWMKNTPLSLDLIFMDGKGRVVALFEDTVPFRETPSYRSRRPARYVLETRAGFAKRHDLKEGDLIELQSLFRVAVPYRWPEK